MHTRFIPWLETLRSRWHYLVPAVFLAFPLVLSTTACHGQNDSSKVAGWWYSEQPDGFQDHSIGGGGRPRQVTGSVTAGTRGGTAASSNNSRR